jgi:hypothetical protein
MQWMHRFEIIGGRPTPIYIDESGAESSGRFADLRDSFPGGRPGTNYLTSDLHLRTLRPASPDVYPNAFGFKNSLPSRHTIFEFDLDGRRFHVPAGVLIIAIIGTVARLAEELLNVGALSSLVIPVVSGNEIRVGFHRRHYLMPPIRAQLRQQNRFLWLTCFPSGRRLWSSIGQQAHLGKLHLELPEASFSGSIRAVRKGDTFYVTSMSVRSLTPHEPALPFTRGLLPAEIEFNAFLESRAEHIRTVHSRKIQRSTSTRDLGFPPGPAGWALTDAEWGQLMVELKLRGYPGVRHSLKSVNAIIEKYTTGQPWKNFGDFTAPLKVLKNWETSGQWAAFVEIMKGLRAG